MPKAPRQSTQLASDQASASERRAEKKKNDEKERRERAAIARGNLFKLVPAQQRATKDTIKCKVEASLDWLIGLQAGNLQLEQMLQASNDASSVNAGPSNNYQQLANEQQPDDQFGMVELEAPSDNLWAIAGEGFISPGEDGGEESAENEGTADSQQEPGNDMGTDEAAANSTTEAPVEDRINWDEFLDSAWSGIQRNE